MRQSPNHRFPTFAMLLLMLFGAVAFAADTKEVKLDAAQQDAANKLRAKGAAVMQIAADTDGLSVNLGIVGKQANDADLALVKLLPKVQELDLHNTSITDSGLANIAGFTELARLHLNGTAITDAGLVYLKNLSALEYLNLYGDAITDAGLKNLEGLKKLKHIYLWQTKVTDAGAKELKSAIPGIVVNRGEELSLPPPATNPAIVPSAGGKSAKGGKTKGKKKTPAAAAAAPAESADIDNDGFIRTWLVLGPIQVDGGADIEKQQLPNEKDVKPKAGDKATVGGKEIVWKKVTAKDYDLDFNQALSAAGQNNVAAYAVTYIDSPKEMKDLTLLMGSNDEGRLYLNGKELIKHAEPRSLEKDADKAMNITLAQGTNVLVLKVINEANDWQGCVRFTDKDGKPAKDLKVKVEK